MPDFTRFLLQSCGPAAASLQMLKGKEQERRGPGWVSEIPSRAAFVAVNGTTRSREPLQMVAAA